MGNPVYAGVEITPEHVRFLEAIEASRKPGLADRPEDRRRQAMRRLGWVKYAGTPRRWQLTRVGEVALADIRAKREGK